MTKERPISYSRPMVRARNAGLKTMTRRALKVQPPADYTPSNRGYPSHDFLKNGQRFDAFSFYQSQEGTLPKFWPPSKFNELLCPHGSRGDQLWIREAWRTVHQADALPPRHLTAAHRIWYEADAPHQLGYGRYRPPMFMPRWASRGLDEITSVRVERLQEISEADALAEGLEQEAVEQLLQLAEAMNQREPSPCREIYKVLWEKINGSNSWAENPWVWVIEFKVLKK